MSTRVLAGWVLGLAGLAGLSSCAVRPVGAERHFQCTPGICSVEVTVVEEGSRCSAKLVDAQQTTLRMPRGEPDVVIRWYLSRAVEATHEFRDSSIRLKTGTTSEFQLPGAIGGGKKFQIVNKNSNNDTYEYDIKVYSRTTAQVCELDPFIRNVN